MLVETIETRAVISPRALRKQIDRSVSRALVDSAFATQLLSDPTVALGEHGCSPQQFKSLRNVRALDLVDFTQQVYALFWAPESTSSSLEASAPLAAASI